MRRFSAVLSQDGIFRELICLLLALMFVLEVIYN